MQKKHISILAMKNANYASIIDARSVFTKANELFRVEHKKDVFEIEIIGEEQELMLEDGLVSIKPDRVTKNIEKTDLIIIPALRGDMLSSSHYNRFFVDWIIKQYKRNAEVASLCTGAFMLAFTGLLKEKKCTTHWQYANEFRFYYPNITLIDEKIIVEQNGLYSSGGGTAYWNLLLFLVEKYISREMAILVAKYFVVNLDKMVQTPFIVFNGLKEHNDREVLKAQEFIEEQYAEKITVDDLSEKLFLTRRTFERRFKKATHCTVLEYLQKVRIEASKKSLEIGRKSVDEIMLDVGYFDSQTFRELFKKITGITPLEYRDKYKK
ncbi:GlxA family transcriptional regulator [Solitalea canadensis]|uniref:Transcriptional regulator containing an amidase domain and an AraC-type DNA-binding HTH domain n=1 Tax=Solitalea canadensis (strain ATCC 29591 / DSM 3403 / JCM 21819 / LMG 8368 / NBRC 15130 / NCIMB 12057 / USAM 9D) TaxID=929556 RepID=H8KXK7_SOLCM|nr:helix-turn-helix domain-containing protein [Solitalea canadensis]AFD05303.1 transcriptional regulator containing an amidase domain and an AraC-type DNA-binding HTH domain [Solitalea canadensis DSM 3403]